MYNTIANTRKIVAQIKTTADDDLRVTVDDLLPRTTRPNPKFQQSVEHLHALGLRALAAFITEIEQRYGAGWIDESLDQFRALRPEHLAAIGANRFPPIVATLTGGRR